MRSASALILIGVMLLCFGGCKSVSTIAGAIKCENQSEPVIEYKSECRETDR